MRRRQSSALHSIAGCRAWALISYGGYEGTDDVLVLLVARGIRIMPLRLLVDAQVRWIVSKVAIGRPKSSPREYVLIDNQVVAKSPKIDPHPWQAAREVSGA